MASWALAWVIGLFVLSSAYVFQPCQAASLIKYRESYIVKYQAATCNGLGGKLILLGPKDPIALYGAGNFQVFTKAVSAGQKVPLDMWNQTLIREPSVYQIEQSGNTEACIDVDPDSDAGSILAQDVCVDQFTQRQEFQYKVVRQNLPSCRKDNRNGWAVIIKALSNPQSNLCLSASNTPGVRATKEICNELDENQLFFHQRAINQAPVVTTSKASELLGKLRVRQHSVLNNSKEPRDLTKSKSIVITT